MAFCTVAQVKQYLGISQPDDDALLSDLIDAAQGAIDKYCHRTFEAASDTTRYIDAVGNHIIDGRVLYLDDIGELAQITTVTNGDSIEVTSSEYITDPRNRTPYRAIRILSSSGKTWTYSTDWEGSISILGRWAYSITADDVIAEACVEMAAFYYRQKDQPFQDVTAVEAGVVIRPVGIPAYIKTKLDHGYVKP